MWSGCPRGVWTHPLILSTSGWASKSTQHLAFLKHWWVALSPVPRVCSAFSTPGSLRMCILAGSGGVEISWTWEPSLALIKTHQTPQAISFCCPSFPARGWLFPTFSRFPKLLVCTVWRSHLTNTRKSAWPDGLLHHVAANVFTLFCQIMAGWAKYSEALGCWPSFYFSLELTATYLLFGRTSTGVYLDSNLALFCWFFLLLFFLFFF